MTKPVSDFSPEHWLKHAQDARDKARQMKDPAGKAELETIARGYDRLASHAATRRKQALGSMIARRNEEL
jgi:hypothetical protein